MSTPYEKALAAIDAAHALDPKKIKAAGPAGAEEEVPYELHYANKMTAYLDKHISSSTSASSSDAGAASEALRLAVRAQHLRRWEVPRDGYPATKAGYHGWRNALKKRQAELARGMCAEAGYGEAEAERVAALVRKDGLLAGKGGGADPETQVLEDVACLVFLDDQFEEFERGYDEEKVVAILRKTWGKMSERGHELALQIPMGERPLELVKKALGG
ncbi:glutamyl-trna synthetase [Diplodia corticola]|uniref:Glutamyl-trna synthetase n=1 Tax=Diplodia corticola TaxID=236234 RepID=A0A1J9S296_9PEZI|nr:glutamyl-trna synthetase [Diplodia corticola]OJD34695.1 glutamyl-trna synthetase [Diplodia corticola]